MSAGSDPTEESVFSGINMTPLVDITLVLLIIFMVTAKLIVSTTLPMDLPKASTGSEQQLVFAVSLAANGTTTVDSERVTSDDAVRKLAQEAKAEHPKVRAVIHADQSVAHGRVVRVMDLLKQGGIGKIAFGVTPEAAQAVAAGPGR